jgi:hypothetical protein
MIVKAAIGAAAANSHFVLQTVTSTKIHFALAANPGPTGRIAAFRTTGQCLQRAAAFTNGGKLIGRMAPAPTGVAMRHTADVRICL